jgi:copper oxidase (laccase) domain-containing protein
MSNLYRGPSIDASYQVSVHLAKRFRKRRFRTRPIRNKNCLWWPCLLTHRDEMSNLYRGPSIDASYQVSVHLAKRFRRRRFKKNRSIKNKNCLWRPCLLTDRDEMSNLYRGPSIDASYQVSVHLIKRFRRRFKKIGQSETRIACGGHVC